MPGRGKFVLFTGLVAGVLVVVGIASAAFNGETGGHLTTTIVKGGDGKAVFEEGGFEKENAITGTSLRLTADSSVVLARFSAATRCFAGPEGLPPSVRPKDCSVQFELYSADLQDYEADLEPTTIVVDTVGDGGTWDAHTVEASIAGVPPGDYFLDVLRSNKPWFAVKDTHLTVDYGPEV